MMENNMKKEMEEGCSYSTPKSLFMTQNYIILETKLLIIQFNDI